MNDRLFLDELFDVGPFVNEDVIVMMSSLLEILEPFHERQQCHKQIGPHTIWFEATLDEMAKLHICDPEEYHPSNRRCACRPPGSEHEGHVWSSKDDVWQLGYTMLQLILGRTCSCYTDHAESLMSEEGELPILPTGLSLECIDFLMDCLNPDPAQRPSVKELKGHSFLNCSDNGIDDVVLSLSSLQLQDSLRKDVCRPLTVSALRSTRRVKFVSPSHTSRCRKCLKCEVDVEAFRSNKLCACACEGSDLSPKSAAPTKRDSSGHDWNEPEVLKRIRLMEPTE
eukprot:764746-Hanusia_phi.AAC.7